jgi:hypothetical protein
LCACCRRYGLFSSISAFVYTSYYGNRERTKFAAYDMRCR